MIGDITLFALQATLVFGLFCLLVRGPAEKVLEDLVLEVWSRGGCLTGSRRVEVVIVVVEDAVEDASVEKTRGTLACGLRDLLFHPRLIPATHHTALPGFEFQIDAAVFVAA